MHAGDPRLWRQAPRLRKLPVTGCPDASTIWSEKTHAPGLAPSTVRGPLLVWLNVVPAVIWRADVVRTGAIRCGRTQKVMRTRTATNAARVAAMAGRVRRRS